MFNNDELELSALSSAMFDKDCVNKLLDLTKDDFYNNDNKKVYDVIETIKADNEEVGLVSVYTELSKKHTKFAERFMKKQLDYTACYSYNMDYYIKEIRRLANRRQIYIDLDDATKDLKSGEEIEKIIDDIETKTKELDYLGTKYKTLADSGIDKNNISMEGQYYTTGLGSFDFNCRGLYPGNVIVIAARPKEGKTTLAMNIAQHISLKKDVLFFSLEMTVNELYYRILAHESEVEMNDILTKKHCDKVEKTIPIIEEKYKRLKIYDDIDKLHLIKSEARKQARKGKLGLIVIDYLQLVTVKGEERLREKTVIMTRQFKNLAKELKVPIIELSQFARNDEKEWPKLRWLKESGSIENDADIILFLHTEKKEGSSDKMWLMVAAGRNVKRGANRIYLHEGKFRFEDYVEG